MHKRFWLIFLLLGCCSAAYAQTAGIGTSQSDVVNMVGAAIEKSSSGLFSDATRWLAGFMILQLLLTNWKLLPGADLDSVMAKLVGSIVWFGFCWYLMDAGPGFIKAVGGEFWAKYASNIPTPGTIIALTVSLAGSLFGIATLVGGTGIGTVLGQGLMLISLCLGGAGVFFAFKAFLLQVELVLIVMVSPLSFSLLGLNALRDQGFSPFKSLLALLYRILIYGVIFSSLLTMMDVVKDVIVHYTSLNWDAVSNLTTGGPEILKAIMGAIGGEFLLLMLLWKADTVASTLASGSSSLGGADMAGAVAAGVAAGMGAHTASEALMRPAQGMGDIMRGLLGKGMDMSNASPQGTGGLTGISRPDMGGSMSLGESASDGGSMGTGVSPNSGGTMGSGTSMDKGGAGGQLPPNQNEFTGVPNPIPSEKVRDPARDAAREARRQARMGGSGSDAGISGPGGGSEDALKQIADALSTPRPKGMRDHLAELNQHAAQERASTSVHINTHHD